MARSLVWQGGDYGAVHVVVPTIVPPGDSTRMLNVVPEATKPNPDSSIAPSGTCPNRTPDSIRRSSATIDQNCTKPMLGGVIAITRSTLQSGVHRITGGELPDTLTSTGPLQAGASGSSPQAMAALSSANELRSK